MTTPRARRGVTASPLTPLYRPAEIAEALGCSEWWVKEQARKGRIPFTRTGGSYRFTAEHYQEIIRVFEERPTRVSEPNTEEGAPGRSRRSGATPSAAAATLRPKRPRRVNRAESTRTAA
ncbi:helix-turn-helix domain-containing protein [Streptomyces sp. NBC_00316]|uniref:helix-turn-helix domain-containing protein n=1 Tax=Streptomyces sp. NBC_00316 TaxID=2975710 RepID=UPI002E2D2FD3|nr:helix-turn-helix domain-containing protein [Streptomyces sp. NBC_00316]